MQNFKLLRHSVFLLLRSDQDLLDAPRIYMYMYMYVVNVNSDTCHVSVWQDNGQWVAELML